MTDTHYDFIDTETEEQNEELSERDREKIEDYKELWEGDPSRFLYQPDDEIDQPVFGKNPSSAPETMVEDDRETVTMTTEELLDYMGLTEDDNPPDRPGFLTWVWWGMLDLLGLNNSSEER
jgi:hypothetical protein